jgi:hypothetical protein
MLFCCRTVSGNKDSFAALASAVLPQDVKLLEQLRIAGVRHQSIGSDWQGKVC